MTLSLKIYPHDAWNMRHTAPSGNAPSFKALREKSTSP